MKVRIVIEGGKVQAFAENGTFEEAAPALLALLKDMGAQGITFEGVSPVEQHRHDAEEVRNDVRAG